MVRSIVPISMIGKLLKVGYMRIRNIFTIIILFLFLSACDKSLDFLSKSVILDMKPPPGPPEFQAGYVDGCSTALNENNHNAVAMLRKRLYKHPIMNKKCIILTCLHLGCLFCFGLSLPFSIESSFSFLFCFEGMGEMHSDFLFLKRYGAK